MIRYKVVVSGKSVIYDGRDWREANRRFSLFVSRSKIGAELKGGLTVFLFKNYEVIRRWYQTV
jgi:hypothetical protein